MKKTIIMLGVALAWAVGGLADTHEGVQLQSMGAVGEDGNLLPAYDAAAHHARATSAHSWSAAGNIHHVHGPIGYTSQGWC